VELLLFYFNTNVHWSIRNPPISAIFCSDRTCPNWTKPAAIASQTRIIWHDICFFLIFDDTNVLLTTTDKLSPSKSLLFSTGIPRHRSQPASTRYFAIYQRQSSCRWLSLTIQTFLMIPLLWVTLCLADDLISQQMPCVLYTYTPGWNKPSHSAQQSCVKTMLINI
jgi:hypothetical protein